MQIFNIALFFFLVIKFMAKPISKAIEARVEKEKKLARADETYREIIAEAKRESESLIAGATEHRRRIVEEATALSQQKGDEIMEVAQRKADELMNQAAIKVSEMKQELESGFEESVKHTSQLVVQKLLGQTDLQQDYLQTLVKELTHERPRHENN